MDVAKGLCKITSGIVLEDTAQEVDASCLDGGGLLVGECPFLPRNSLTFFFAWGGIAASKCGSTLRYRIGPLHFFR